MLNRKKLVSHCFDIIHNKHSIILHILNLKSQLANNFLIFQYSLNSFGGYLLFSESMTHSKYCFVLKLIWNNVLYIRL